MTMAKNTVRLALLANALRKSGASADIPPVGTTVLAVVVAGFEHDDRPTVAPVRCEQRRDGSYSYWSDSLGGLTERQVVAWLPLDQEA